MKAKAMVLEEFNGPLLGKLLTLPQVDQGQVLVKIKASGVCGSDVHMWRGEDPRTPLPIILGHEGVGEVVDVGGSVSTVQGEQIRRGDLVLWNRGVSCGRCYYCVVLKEPSLCNQRKVYGINRSSDEYPHLNGCYAEYVLLTAGTDLFRIEADIDPAVLVSASCSGATVAHAFDLEVPKVGDTVVVQGPGPLGLYSVAFARAYGASQIIVIGGSPSRMQLCEKFGATMLLNRKNTTVEERKHKILSVTGGRGADIVVEATGYASALVEGVNLVRPGGAYLSTGFAQPVGNIELDPYTQIVRKNVKIQGVWVSDTSHTYRAMQLVLSQPELFKHMITHRFKLEDANQALQSMADKMALKAVLTP